jgi:hypothetical protein
MSAGLLCNHGEPAESAERLGWSMASPFVVEERKFPGAATHAIVIGVGRYPHLPGGGEPPVKGAGAMKQLTSPPISARRFADWLISSYDYPDKPLGSVALLVSEKDPKLYVNPKTGAEMQLEVPTIEALKAALIEWRGRGDAAANQRLIFYFCGHGIGRGSDTALLAADYGANPFDELDGAIDFRNFLAGMTLSEAGDQIYFVDACRVSSGALLNAGTYSGRPIFKPDLGQRPNPQLRAPVFYATLAGTSAYGREGEPTFYTAALLYGLSGAGAISEPEGWRVTADGLKRAINFQLEDTLKRAGRAQVPAEDNAVELELQRVTGTPNAVAIVYCDSNEATAAATFSYTLNANVQRRPGGGRGEWRVEIPADYYEFTAEFKPASWMAPAQKALVAPAATKVMLRATRT